MNTVTAPEILKQRDYTLIIDKSASMSTPDQRNGRTRWEEVQESTLGLARKCEQLDSDGITVYLFAGRFKRYDNVTSGKVAQIFEENEPGGSTDLAGVLKDAFNNYFQRKSIGQTKPNGEIILVVTDGEPDDRTLVMKEIVEASCRIDQDVELGITFLQVGLDPKASQFLKALDTELTEVGARFDVCDTMTFEQMENQTLTEVLIGAIKD